MTMAMFVRTLTQEVFTVFVEPTDVVRAVKAKVAEQTGVPCERQPLLFAGQPLHDERTLWEHKIPAESTLELALRLRGTELAGPPPDMAPARRGSGDGGASSGRSRRPSPTTGLHYYEVRPGLNYAGTCRAPHCLAGKAHEKVMCHRGFGHALSARADVARRRVACPGCGTPLAVEALYFSRCRVHMSYVQPGPGGRRVDGGAKPARVVRGDQLWRCAHGDSEPRASLHFDVQPL